VSEFNDLLKMLQVPNKVEKKKISETTQSPEIIIPESSEAPNLNVPFEILPNLPTSYSPFNIDIFNQELFEKSAVKNQLYRDIVQNISAYDISSGCIRDIFYKLTNTPVESFADKWLPILMRSTIGTAIHDFVQSNTNQFTEREVSLKVPSIKFSGRLDNLIGPNILVEIKSCTYSDYEKIIRTRKPRVSDFYQTMVYKYILEKHLAEAKDPNIKIRKGTSKPKFEKYDIQTIQFIYIAHDVTATDVESFGEVLNKIKELKRLLNSKSNSFFFMTTLVIDTINDVAEKYLEYVENKIKYINYYIDNNIIPPADDPFIDKSACFFCLYSREVCDLCGRNGNGR